MSRLSCPSRGLQLRMLYRRAQGTFWASLALAVGLHGLLSQAPGVWRKERLAKPLTTQFIKREPRLTKRLEMKKEPRPRRRPMKRSMVSVKPEASPSGASVTARPPQLLPILARPGVTVSRMGYTPGLGMEAQVAAHQIVGTREDENVVDMCLEMLEMDDLDTGRYHALVIEDPQDKRNIRGFLHLAVVYASSLTQFEGEKLMNPRAVRALAALADAMNEYTQIKTDVRGPFPFDSPSIFRTPWVHVQYGIWPGYTTDGELAALGKYALWGGFMFVDSLALVDRGGRVEKCQEYRWAIVHALALNGLQRGRNWEFERMDDDHPLFHCFFDFEGPPAGGWGRWWSEIEVPPELPNPDAVNIDGRVIAMWSHHSYSIAWSGQWYEYFRMDNTRQLQFGVNLLVFALTQEGGLTKRVMNSFTGY